MSASEKSNLLLQNPFVQHLKPEEVLVWVGRPDEELWMKRTWRAFRQGCLWGSVIATICLIGLFYGPDPLTRFSCRFFLIAIALAFLVALWLVPQNYRYAPWYALTQNHFFVSAFDEGDFPVRRRPISEIVEVRLSGGVGFNRTSETRDEVGTLVCKCKCVMPDLLSKQFKIEMVDQPKQVLALIEEAIYKSKTGPKDLA